MRLIRVTKKFRFEMAHALQGYDGHCKNVHGHSYELSVTIQGNPVSDNKVSDNGMVMDYSQLKAIVNDVIINQFDHSFVISQHTPHQDIKHNNQLFGNMIIVPYQPTCENLLVDFVERIKNKLPVNVKLFSLKLSETVTSYAEWFADDNKS